MQSTDDAGYWFFGADGAKVLNSMSALVEGGRLRVAFENSKPGQYTVYAGPAEIDEASHREFASCMGELAKGMESFAANLEASKRRNSKTK